MIHNKWQKFWQLTSQERLLLIQALLLMPTLSLTLRIIGLQRLMKILSRTTRENQIMPYAPDYAYRAANMTNLAAGQRPLQATCLQRSVVLWWLLRRKGIDSQIVLGIRKENARQLQAHAWVEYQGNVLNDRPEIRGEFTIFSEL